MINFSRGMSYFLMAFPMSSSDIPCTEKRGTWTVRWNTCRQYPRFGSQHPTPLSTGVKLCLHLRPSLPKCLNHMTYNRELPVTSNTMENLTDFWDLESRFAQADIFHCGGWFTGHCEKDEFVKGYKSNCVDEDLGLSCWTLFYGLCLGTAELQLHQIEGMVGRHRPLRRYSVPQRLAAFSAGSATYPAKRSLVNNVPPGRVRVFASP